MTFFIDSVSCCVEAIVCATHKGNLYSYRLQQLTVICKLTARSCDEETSEFHLQESILTCAVRFMNFS